MIPTHPTTLWLNGKEVRAVPSSFQAERMSKERNIVELPCGPVEILWPGPESTYTVTAHYTNLDDEDAEAIVVYSATDEAGGTVSFGESVYTCKTIRVDASLGRGWNVTLAATMTWLPL